MSKVVGGAATNPNVPRLGGVIDVMFKDLPWLRLAGHASSGVAVDTVLV